MKFIIFSIISAIVWLFLVWTVDTEVTWSRIPVQILNYLSFICLVFIKILTETNFEAVFTIWYMPLSKPIFTRRNKRFGSP